MGKDNNMEKSYVVKEKYSPGYGEKLISSYEKRNVLKEASFLLPYLSNNMNILDCGCGPGSITVGIAEYVNCGHVNAIDIEPRQIEKAKKLAHSKGVANIDFSVGSIYELPFKEETFDVVFAHAVFQHLNDPISALNEINRVLKPGGIVALRDDDQDSLIIGPKSNEMDKVIYLLKECLKVSGGNPLVGKELKRLLIETKFTNVIGSASCECDGTVEETSERAKIAIELLNHMKSTACSKGWTNERELEILIEKLKQWGNDPGAYDTITWCEVIGWKKG